MKVTMTAAASLVAAFAIAVGTANAAMMGGATDQAFVKGATQSNLAEIAAGKLAMMKSHSTTVKYLGKRMFDDHSKAYAMLTGIAHAQGMQTPTMPNAMQMATASALKKLAGAQFDTMWLKTQETGHEQTVALFKSEISSGTDPALVAFAKKNLPVIEEHLDKLTTAATMPMHGGSPAPGMMSPHAMMSPSGVMSPAMSAQPTATPSTPNPQQS